MKIKKIDLQNVKCFREESFSFLKKDTEEPLSVCALVGANGSGKSTILKALVAGFSALDSSYSGELFEDEDVSLQNEFLKVEIDVGLNEEEMSIIESRESQLKICYMHYKKDMGYNICDEMVLPSNVDEIQWEEYEDKIDAFTWDERTGLIMYYDPFRFISGKNPSGPNIQEWEDAKTGALLSNFNKDGENSYRDFDLKQWIYNMDYMRLKEPTMRNNDIYNHMIRAFDLLLHPLRFETINQKGKLVFVNESDGERLSIDMLSDGFKSIFSIVLDIIRRLALVSESEEEEFYKKEAVILIDEIDCHIHPRWQRKLVPAFRELFPNCQFILTTHSPYILDGLQSYEIIKVGEKEIL